MCKGMNTKKIGRMIFCGCILWCGVIMKQFEARSLARHIYSHIEETKQARFWIRKTKMCVVNRRASMDKWRSKSNKANVLVGCLFRESIFKCFTFYEEWWGGRKMSTWQHVNRQCTRWLKFMLDFTFKLYYKFRIWIARPSHWCIELHFCNSEIVLSFLWKNPWNLGGRREFESDFCGLC